MGNLHSRNNLKFFGLFLRISNERVSHNGDLLVLNEIIIDDPCLEIKNHHNGHY